VAEDVIGQTPEIWGKEYSTKSAHVQRDYDTFAKGGQYDETFLEWGYVGPQTAAAIMLNYVGLQAHVLDAACGSGLTGTALRTLGYAHIDGIDISEELLRLAAQTGAYETVTAVDMQAFPLPFEDDAFDAVCFIGALTYFETPEILRQLCRITRAGGHIVFSQRDDIMRDQSYGDRLDDLEREGWWSRVLGTDPMPYLPHHPRYGTQIKVQYFVYEVS
jgi:predicted TPR repeat methyltransferase